MYLFIILYSSWCKPDTAGNSINGVRTHVIWSIFWKVEKIKLIEPLESRRLVMIQRDPLTHGDHEWWEPANKKLVWIEVVWWTRPWNRLEWYQPKLSSIKIFATNVLGTRSKLWRAVGESWKVGSRLPLQNTHARCAHAIGARLAEWGLTCCTVVRCHTRTTLRLRTRCQCWVESSIRRKDGEGFEELSVSSGHSTVPPYHNQLDGGDSLAGGYVRVVHSASAC